MRAGVLVGSTCWWAARVPAASLTLTLILTLTLTLALTLTRTLTLTLALAQAGACGQSPLLRHSRWIAAGVVP